LDSNDGKFHCDLPLEYDFKQCTVAMQSNVLSAILLEGTLMANHLFSSQQFLVDPSTLKRHSQQDAQAAILACDWSRLLNVS
jgi:hypothetical protein